MTVPTYPNYKESGVELIGEVPSHWKVCPLKWLLERNDGGVWGDDPDDVADTIVLRSTEQTVDGRWVIEEPAKRRLSEADDLRYRLEEGDLLVTKSSGSALHIGKTTLVDREIAGMRCCFSNFMQRLRMKPGLSPRVAWHVLNNTLARRQFELLSHSTTGLANLSGGLIGQLMVPVAPPSEQTAIATFLDRETGRIDALVAEQRRLIALLKEKRQAVISRAVAKGLNPDAPMKPSGIEWLGDVPEHWDHTRAGRFIQVLPGYAFPSSGFSHDESRTKLLRGANVGVGEIRWNEVVYWERKDGDNLEHFEMSEGALVIGMDRPFIGAGVRVARLQEADLPCLLLQRVGEISTNEHMGRDYFQLLLQSEGFMHFVAPDMTGVSVPHISPGQLRDFPIPVPPVEEQRQIVAFVSNEAAKIDALVFEAEAAITLLQERRSALISAAVTGKIDVRGLVSAETEAAQVA